jgi:hypothetical protein
VQRFVIVVQVKKIAEMQRKRQRHERDSKETELTEGRILSCRRYHVTTENGLFV